MTIWIGFGRWSENYLREISARLRSGQTAAQANEELGFTARARAFRQNVPQGCRLVGWYGPQGIGAHPAVAEFPSVTIIETDDPAHVAWATNYWGGYANFAFHPYTEVPLT